MNYKITVNNEEETEILAQNIESYHFKGMVICLNGDLGSGKTVFTKAFAHSLEINDNITSPTFNIIKEYNDGQLPLYHMDVYRLDGKTSEIDFDDYFYGDGVTIIEWAELISDILPDERLDIEFKVLNENSRSLKLIPHGKKYEEILESVI